MIKWINILHEQVSLSLTLAWGIQNKVYTCYDLIDILFRNEVAIDAKLRYIIYGPKYVDSWLSQPDVLGKNLFPKVMSINMELFHLYCYNSLDSSGKFLH